jgi:DNA polymerase-4
MDALQATMSRPDLREAALQVYKDISLHIRSIFAEHTSVIEPLSLDEAYLDVTENLKGIPLARDIALQRAAEIADRQT